MRNPLHSLARFAQIATLGAAALLLGGCNAIKLGYNNSPELAYWWLNDYVGFTDTQGALVRQELARLQPWHRSNEMPKIADLLARTRTDAGRDVTPEQICRLFTDVQARVEAATDKAEAGAVSLAMSLNTEQLDEIEAKMKKSNADWQKEWTEGTPEKRTERRLKAAVKRFEQIYDSVTPAQRDMLKANIASSNFDPGLSYTERLRRQQDLMQTLRAMGAAASSKPSVAQATAALRAYSDRSLNSPNLAYRAYVKSATQSSCQNLAALHNASTPAQRTAAVSVLAGYERDARDLVAQR
jgi:hypothetical protein